MSTEQNQPAIKAVSPRKEPGQSEKSVDYIVISVESQKGGVGKTTAALNVARLLLDKGHYRVLLFDLDIAGTEAASIQSSPIWKEDTNVVTFDVRKQKDGKVETVPSNNLVALYDEYMSGSSIPHFEWRITDPTSPSTHVFDPKKINILSSCLVRAGNGQRLHQHGPQVLFDEAHAEWFLEMIQGIVNKGQDEKHKLAVVIDSSPGFSGLGPNIEEWLTDLGLERGKFLFVASADQQDISACIHAIRRVEAAFEVKLEGAQLLAQAKADLTGETIPGLYAKAGKGQQKFFMRLAEHPSDLKLHKDSDGTTSKQSDGRTCLLKWYQERSVDIDPDLARISNSWALIHNRVPLVLMNEELSDHLETMVPEVPGEKMVRILARCRNGIRRRAIAHSLEFALQFVNSVFLQKGAKTVDATPIFENGARLPDFPKLQSGGELLRYVLDAHLAFHHAAAGLPAPSDTNIRVPWVEFSPAWLFTQQLRSGAGAAELARLSRMSGADFGRAAFSAYELLVKYTQESRPSATSVSWVQEAVMVAHALRFAMQRTGHPGSQILVKVSQHAARVCQGLDEPPFQSLRLPPWPQEPISIPNSTGNNEWQAALSQIHPSGGGFIPKRVHAIVFVNAYNHVLRAPETVALMESVARFARTGENTALLLLFAEALFRHVVLQRDISPARAISLLQDISGGKMTEPAVLFRLVSSLKEMTAFTQVLDPILGPAGWEVL